MLLFLPYPRKLLEKSVLLCALEVVLALREAEVCLVTAERVSDGSSL